MSKDAKLMLAAFTVAAAFGTGFLWESAEATNATTMLKNEGYTDIEVTRGKRYKTSAPIFTLYAAKFKARDADGHVVKGEVSRNLGKPAAFQLQAAG